MALGLFQHYLLSECHLTLLRHITQKEIQGWVAFLGQQPTWRGHLRTTGTIASYLRSARALFRWLVRHNSLEYTPFAHLPLLKAEPPPLEPLEPEEFQCLLLACRPPGETDVLAERATVRNQAILWVFADTGMRVSELCGLRLWDIDREHGRLRVQKKGSRPRQLPLSQDGLRALLAYLDESRPEAVECIERAGAGQESPLPLGRVSSPHRQWDRPRVWPSQETSRDHEKARGSSPPARDLRGAVSARRRRSLRITGPAWSAGERHRQTLSTDERIGDGERQVKECLQRFRKDGALTRSDGECGKIGRKQTACERPSRFC